MADTRTLYDEDFVAWTEQQAEALRSAARSSTNQPLDWENLAEKIESLGKSDRREVHSQTYRIIQHLAKLQFSPASDPRSVWRDTIHDARKQLQLLLTDSPSLKAQLSDIVSQETPSASTRAISDLRDFDEVDPPTIRLIRRARYTVDQMLGEWFPPDRTRPKHPSK